MGLGMMAKDMGAEVAFSSVLPLKGNGKGEKSLRKSGLILQSTINNIYRINPANQQLVAKLEMTTGLLQSWTLSENQGLLERG